MQHVWETAGLGPSPLVNPPPPPLQVKNEVEKLPRQQRKENLKQKLEEHAQKKQQLVCPRRLGLGSTHFCLAASPPPRSPPGCS